MELYIEKEFLDNLKDGNHDLITTIFIYGDKTIYMDITINSMEELTRLKNENELFALICDNDKVPIPVESISEHLFQNSSFEQTMVFIKEEHDWFKEANKKGALCFSFDNYKENIKEIINKLHFKIDLSEPFQGWDFLNKFQHLTFNRIVITDGYILSDRAGQKIEENIIPILRILLGNNGTNIKVDVLTKDLNPISGKEEHKKEKAKKRYRHLRRELADNLSNLSIIMYDVDNPYDFHDRIIQTNFSLLDCGKGFNLSDTRNSNSQIISETIFEKYTYKRLRNHIRMQKEYRDILERLETVRFKMYPLPN